jgi:predicted RNA-binding Zn-ribbon protein involved in translation (DUF1610 family)
MDQKHDGPDAATPGASLNGYLIMEDDGPGFAELGTGVGGVHGSRPQGMADNTHDEESDSGSVSESERSSVCNSSSSDDSASDPIPLEIQSKSCVEGSGSWYCDHRLDPVFPGHKHSSLHYCFQITEMRRSGSSARSCTRAATMLREAFLGSPGASERTVCMPPSLHTIRHIVEAEPPEKYVFYWCPGCGHRYSGSESPSQTVDVGCSECGFSSLQVCCAD